MNIDTSNFINSLFILVGLLILIPGFINARNITNMVRGIHMDGKWKFIQILVIVLIICFAANVIVMWTASVELMVQFLSPIYFIGAIFASYMIRTYLNTLVKFKSNETSLSHMIQEVQDYSIIRLDKNGKIRSWNMGAEKIKGYKAKEVVGKSMDMFYTQEDRDANLPKQLLEVATLEGKTANEGFRLKKDGSTFWANVTITTIHDGNGNIEGFSKVTRDVTERKTAENMFKGLLESAPDATVIVNEKGSIQLVNKQAEKLFGYSSEELIGDKVEKLISAKFSNHEAHRDNFFNNPKPREMGEGKELLARNKAGEDFPVEISLSPLKTESGVLVSAAIRDITKRKAADYELARKNDLLNLAEKVSQIGHWQWDLKTNKVIWSENLYSMFGHNPEIPLFYDTYFSYVYSEDEAYVTECVQKSLADKKFHNFFHRIKTGEGKIKTIHLIGILFTDDNDEPIEMLGTCQDVTDIKLAEKKFRDLLDSAPDATVIFNTEGIIDLVNNQVENVFGYSKDELVGHNFSKLIKNKVKEITSITAQSFFEKPKMKLIEGLEAIGEHKTNGKFTAEISVAPIETEEGILFSAAIRDITIWKKEQQALKEYNIQLQTKNKELEQFTYIASHDLQEPLITLRSLIDLIQEETKDNIDAKSQSALSYISDTTVRMSELIKGLLDYGRIGQNKELKTVDCQRLVKEVQKDLATRILESQAKLEIDELPEVQGYETELRMLFQNLIANALKFQKPGRKPLIQISVKKEKEFWQFAVADNGIGIEEENKARIFTIFQRLHKRTDYEGTGIGLAHCRKIVELHWGKIWVESKQNEGSVFYFTIKL